MSGFGRSELNVEAKESLHIFWDTLVYCSETLIFVLAGAIVMDHAFLSKSGLFLAQVRLKTCLGCGFWGN